MFRWKTYNKLELLFSFRVSTLFKTSEMRDDTLMGHDKHLLSTSIPGLLSTFKRDSLFVSDLNQEERISPGMRLTSCIITAV